MYVCAHACVGRLIYIQGFVCPNMHGIFSIQVADQASFPSKNSECVDLLVARGQITATNGGLKYLSNPRNGSAFIV